MSDFSLLTLVLILNTISYGGGCATCMCSLFKKKFIFRAFVVNREKSLDSERVEQ